MADEKGWTATYTKHVRQKRKVYQDGVLALDGSGKKVKLYDDTGKLIDSRFLKKDEVIECGGSLAMENHLVDIGCLEREQKPLPDLNVASRGVKRSEISGKHGLKENKKGVLHTGILQKQSDVVDRGHRVSGKNELSNLKEPQGPASAGNPSVKEWDALYTTQVSQKAKRYHDGILRVSVCGSQTNHIVLLHEDGTVLSSKYLKSVGCVKTGTTYQFPNYLVEICDARPSQIAPKEVLASEQVATSSASRNGKLMNSGKAVSGRPAGNDDLKKDPPEQVMSSSSAKSGNFMSRRRLNITEQFRTASQILSVLQKPLAQENQVPGKLPMEQSPSSHHSDVPLSDVQRDGQMLKVPERMYYEKDAKEEDVCNIGVNPQTGSAENIFFKSGPSGVVSRLMVPDASATKLDMGSIEKVLDSTQSTEEDEVLASENLSLLKVIQGAASDKHSSVGKPSDIHLEPSTVSYYGKENLSDESCNPQVGSTAVLSFSSAKIGNPNQMNGENAAEEKHEKVLSLDASSVSSTAINSKIEGSDIHCQSKTCLKIDDIPTFDLGF